MRQNITPDYSKKVFESYTDFSGGLNSEISNERLKDSECPVFQNVDISGKNSIKRRYGRTKLDSIPITNAQGMFIYRYRNNGVSSSYAIVVGDGKLFYAPLTTGAFQQLTLYDGSNPVTFQTTRTVEAQQYGNTLFIATGSFLVEVSYDYGSNVMRANKAIPYQPTVQEAIYIGTNALAPNPNAYIQDGTVGVLNIIGIQLTDPNTGNTISSGAVGRSINLTAYIQKANAADTIEYQWEVKKSSETTWPTTVAQAFDSTKKTWAYTPDTATNYDFRCTIRKQGTTTPTAVMNVTSFPVLNTQDPTNKPITVSGINLCNRIILHYDRLILAGDTTSPGQIYISDLTNPRYFPTNNTINFDTGKQEEITAITRFQNMLIFFSKTTIQTLVGRSTDDFERYLIHDSIGCSQGRTPKVVGNNVLFLSTEGMQILKPNPYKLENMNVSRIDLQIKSELVSCDRTDAHSFINFNQYWLVLPNQKTIYRYYYETGAWVKDVSDNLNIKDAVIEDDVVYEITTNGNYYCHDKKVYKDDQFEYDMIVETKDFDLDASFNYKKLKRLYLLAKHYSYDVNYFVEMYADSGRILSSESSQVVLNEYGYAEWENVADPNYVFASGSVLGNWTLGSTALGDIRLSVKRSPVQGKCRRTRVRIRHSDGVACELYGIGIEFRLSKP